jgi:hypothetical protein
MNSEEQFSKNGPMYLACVTYRPEEKQVVLDFTVDPERTVKCARTVFMNVEEFQETPVTQPPGDEFYDSPIVIEGGDSHSNRKEFFIEFDGSEIRFFYQGNGKMTRYS